MTMMRRMLDNHHRVIHVENGSLEIHSSQLHPLIRVTGALLVIEDLPLNYFTTDTCDLPCTHVEVSMKWMEMSNWQEMLVF